tara:strand:- start:385 stop:747 length:363 start_codon:yes stop_codon:yes gene_type:complete
MGGDTLMSEEKDEKKKKGGRPRKEIDTELLYKLAQIHCTMKEMVDIIGVSEDTLKRRYAGIIDKGKAEGKMRLRRKQIEVAMQGSAVMLIWLGKQMLSQSDTPITEDDKNILPWSDDAIE